jgi:tol-pal system protein YbgF
MTFLSFNISRKAWFLPGLFLFLTFLPLAGDAQSSDDITNRLGRLENEVSTLGRAVYRGEIPAGAGSVGSDLQANAGTQQRILELEAELRKLTGKLEEKDYAIQQLQQQFEKANQDLILRVQDLEKGGVAPISDAESGGVIDESQAAETSEAQIEGDGLGLVDETATPPQKTTLGVLSSGEGDSATEIYEKAFLALKQGRYDEAQKGFEAFLKDNPSDKLAGNAQYWLGETHYVRGDFEAAARVFAEGFKSYPKGSKAPDNLLKLGITLAAMGKKDDACIALAQVEKSFPDGAQAVLRRSSVEMTRLACD